MAGPRAIGIDLGGTQVRAALVADGTVLRRAAARTDVAGGPRAILAQFRALVDQVCGSDEWATLRGVGVSAPGPLDSETGTILGIPTLPHWTDFPLRDTLSSDLGVPVIVENDGIAAAFGEWQFGAGRGLRHLVYVTVSTGIGGGVVVDGRLMHGRRGMAGHVGHFRIAAEGPRCACGAIGCFEALAAGTALARRARETVGESPDSQLAQRPAAMIEAVDVVAAARAGDRFALSLLREEAECLGAGFTGLIHLYSPERVIMGGGVSNAFDLLEADIHRIIARDALPPFRDVPVVPAGLGDNSGLVGAAALAVAGAR
jgi:glucokinase